MIDCHTHMTADAFTADREDVLSAAKEAGVEAIAVVGQDLSENSGVLDFCASRPELLAFAGLHPDRFGEDREAPDEAALDALEAQIRAHAPQLTGIGEVGLDHWWVKTPERREQQQAALRRLARLAKELDLPLNVHSRSAGHYTIDLLLEAGAARVLMHAFDGKAGHALRAAEAGFVFSIPPSIVRSRQKEKLVRALPMSALALETDSPVLAPEPGARNVPANVRISLHAIAAIKGLPEQAVAESTAQTSRTLFGLPPRA